MKRINTYIRSGTKFLKGNPQLWTTALVGLCIISAFLFMAWRFTHIAQNAQEELVNVRVGALLDAFVVFAPDALENQDRMREKLAVIRKDNPTIDSFVVYAEHGNDSWRVYVSEQGPREGTVVEDMSLVFDYAIADPDNAYTFESQGPDGRYFTTARGIKNSAGTPIAVAVTKQGLAESDKKITDNIRTSMYILFGVLFVITLLFLRHAHIVDFAVLYKKQLEVDSMKDSFISMASHELKSPLSVIRGYIEFLKDDNLDEQKRHEYLHRVDSATEELRLLVDDVLDVSRIEMGRLEVQMQQINTYEILQEVYDMYNTKASKKGITLKITCSDEAKDACIVADKKRTKQACINLVSNAIKYTFTGEVVISQSIKDGMVECAVEDSGIGMTAEEQGKLFTKFYRAEASESEGVSGTGLGLWITKYIIEYMKGEITVESLKGKGSRFVIQFPQSKTEKSTNTQ